MKRYNLELNENYKVVNSYYTGSILDGGGEQCNNCNRGITNVAVIENSKGEKFHVGLDCAETLSNIKGLYDIQIEFAEMKAIHAKVKKAIKNNQKLNFLINTSGEFVCMSGYGLFYKDIEFSKKYLKQYMDKLTNPEKVGFSYNDFKIPWDFPYIKTSENLDFEHTIKINDDFSAFIYVAPYHHMVTNVITGYDFNVRLHFKNEVIKDQRIVMQRDIPIRINYWIKEHFFNQFDNRLN